MKNYVKPEVICLEIFSSNNIASGMANWLEDGLSESNVTLSHITTYGGES